MIRLMIGRELKGNYIAPARPPGDEALEVMRRADDAHTPGRRST